MRKQLCLHKNRYGKYYFRRAVPKHLRKIIGKHEIVRSLGLGTLQAIRKNNFLMTILSDKLFQLAEDSMNKDNMHTYYSFSITEHSCGKKETVLNMNSDDIIAMAESGLSSDQITDVLKSFSGTKKDTITSIDSPRC